MRINQLKLGSLLTYGQMAIGVIINLIYTPVMIRCLGQSEYGLYQTTMSVISMLSVLNLGFSSSYIRYFARYKTQKNEQAIYRLNGQLTIILSGLGIIALLCGLFLTFRLELVFDSGLNSQEYEIAEILMILLSINLAISFPASILTSIISAHEKFVVLKLLGIAKTVLSPLVTLPLLLIGYRSIAMVVITLLISLLTDSCYLYYVIFKLHSRFTFFQFDIALFKDLVIYTSFIALNILIDQVNWNIPKLVLGRYQGTKAVSIYAVGYTLFSYYMMLSSSISGVFTPRIHQIINNCLDKGLLTNVLTDLFVKVGRIQFVILALVASGMVFFGREFIVFWAGANYSDAYYVLLLLSISAIIPLIQNIGIEVQRALNKHHFRSICYTFMAAMNLIISIKLCQKYSAAGAAMATAASMIIANGIIMNVYYHKCCYIDIFLFWKKIIRMFIGMIIPIAFGVFLKYFFVFDTIFKLIGAICIYTMIYGVSMWILALNNYEKKLIKDPIVRLLKK